MARDGDLGERDHVTRVVQFVYAWFSDDKKIVMRMSDVSEF